MHQRLSAVCGLIAPLLFCATIVAFTWLHPGYSHATQAISELGMPGAPYALAWNGIAFVMVGMLATAFALGLARVLGQTPTAKWVSGLMIASGLGNLGWGLFPAEPGFAASMATALHFAMVMLNFFSFLVAVCLFGWKFRSHPYWRPWACFSWGIAVIAVSSFLIPPSVPVGISQRIGIGAYFLWLFVLALGVWRAPAVK